MGKFKQEQIKQADLMLEASGHEMTEEEWKEGGGCCGGGCTPTELDPLGIGVTPIFEAEAPSELDKLSTDIFEASKANGYWDDCVTQMAYVDEVGQTVTMPDFVPSQRDYKIVAAEIHYAISQSMDEEDRYDYLAAAVALILEYFGANGKSIVPCLKELLSDLQSTAK